MKVYTLSGKSGTGKSYQALDLLEKYDINAIIDDGVLIYNRRIVAGKSAKRQATTIRAIKTALIKEDAQKNEILEGLKRNKIESVLIIGTSERMVDLISERLELPKSEVRIRIESITTPEEREIAKIHRHDLGEHIIPAPTMEVKKAFSGYFVHPLKRLKERHSEGRRSARKAHYERSVVRPTFSYLGRYFITERSITDIVNIAAEEIGELDSVSDTYIKIITDGVIIDIAIIIRYGCSIIKAAEKFQKKVAEEVDEMTSLNILGVNVKVDGLMWSNDARNNKD